MGDIRYMAPELLEGSLAKEQVDIEVLKRADVYSLDLACGR